MKAAERTKAADAEANAIQELAAKAKEVARTELYKVVTQLDVGLVGDVLERTELTVMEQPSKQYRHLYGSLLHAAVISTRKSATCTLLLYT